MDSTILSPFYQHLLVAGAIGVIIGLEREFNTHGDQGHIGGIRTFTLVALFGFLCGKLSEREPSGVLIPAMLIGFMALLAVVYVFQVKQGKAGLTTEFAMLITLLLGIMVARGFIQESLAVVVATTAILSLKEQVHGVIRQITQDEMFAFIKFAVLALLVLPILPNTPFGPNNLLNAKELGWVVIIVLSINFIGYLLLKFVGAQKGILMTALIGGLFSSTMVAWVFSARSKEKPDLSAAYASGIIVASSVMFVRVWMLCSLFYMELAWRLFFPLLILFVISLIASYLIYQKKRTNGDTTALDPGNPLDIKNAVLFAGLFVVISLALYYSQAYMGNAGALVSGALSGIADIDAITIGTAKWSVNDSTQLYTAGEVILIAALSNTFFKGLLSYVRGSRDLGRWVAFGFGALMLAGIGWLIFL
ncbi:MAG: MgtC/SapB family protein [Saprospiraceae bacterium]|nr:MgtC/SapB family protein [Saprospiraceae bacterium]